MSRGESRYRRLAFDSVTTLLLRAIGAFGPLISLFLISPATDATLFGLWAALVSLSLVASLADIGAGNFLLSRLPGLLRRREYTVARGLVREVYAKTSAIALGALVATCGLAIAIAANPTFAEDRGEAIAVVLATMVPLALWIPLQLAMRLLFVLENALLANVSQLLMNVGAVLLVWLGITLEAPMGVLALAYALPQTAGLIALNVFVFRRWGSTVSPIAVERCPTSVWRMLPYASVTAFPLLLVGAQPTIVGFIGGVAEVGPFALIWRPVTAVPILFLGAMTPLWVMAAERRLGSRALASAYLTVAAASLVAGSLAGALVLQMTESDDQQLAIWSVVASVLLSVTSLGGVVLAAAGKAHLYAVLFGGLVTWQILFVAMTPPVTPAALVEYLSAALLVLALVVTAVTAVAWRREVLPA